MPNRLEASFKSTKRLPNRLEASFKSNKRELTEGDASSAIEMYLAALPLKKGGGVKSHTSNLLPHKP